MKQPPSKQSKTCSIAGKARILGKNLAEVIVAHNWSATYPGINGIQQRTILLVLPEIVLAPRNMVADLPDTPPSDGMDTEERIEGCWHEASAISRRIISGRYQCATNTGKTITYRRILNTGEIRFEGKTVVILVIIAAGQRAGEEDRCWVQLRITVGPYWLIGNAVKAGIARGAS